MQDAARGLLTSHAADTKRRYPMFSYRLYRESDKDCWITLNRMFMAEEIQDNDLWNDTNKV